MPKKYVMRRDYLSKLSAFRGKDDIVKVITGVRRCGKSTLMMQFIDLLKEDGVPDEKIVRINLEDPEYYNVRSGDDLASILFPTVGKGEGHYVFIDEVQRAVGWERVINSLASGTSADVYITGSNAHLLSSELSTFLTGRYVNIDMLPLSFAEWKELHGNGTDDQTAIRRYMVYGGFPAIDPSFDDESIKTVLRDIYASVVKWDVASRGQLRNAEELDRLMRYLMENIGNPMSLNNIVKGLSASRDLVDRYIGLMREAFLIYRADRYDIASSALNPSPKYYSVDPGLRNMAVGFTQKDAGRVLENIVYLELIRRGNTVRIGKYDAKEIDFVAYPAAGGREYYQVCLSLTDESTAERELRVLREIRNSFPKTVLTLDPVVKHYDESGIVIESVTEWLLGNPSDPPCPAHFNFSTQ